MAALLQTTPRLGIYTTATSSPPLPDLSLLLKHMVPDKDAKEDQQQWTWDVLFTAVTSEIAAAAASGRIDGEAIDDGDHVVHGM